MSFNWRLLLAPPEILDYVVEHEVCHLEVMDHSPRFWRLLASRSPRLARHSGWLRRYGSTLTLERRAQGSSASRPSSVCGARVPKAYALVDAGVCSFADVDRAVTHGLGARWAGIGPFEAMDLAGLDVHAAVAANLWPELATDREPPASLARLVKSGALGVKSGHGLRGDYDPAATEGLIARRDRVLRGVPPLRDGPGEA